MSSNEIVVTGKSSVAADLRWTMSSRPPEVRLAYDGLDEPTHLWEQLEALGWIVPPRPPRPRSSVEWTPDPIAGTDYTILPWRVTDFSLVEGDWTPEQVSWVSEQTFSVLKRNHVAISGTANRLETLEAQSNFAKYTDADADPAPIDHDSAGSPEHEAVPADRAFDDPSAPKRHIFINVFGSDEHPGHVTHHVGTSGRSRTSYVWSEAEIESAAVAGDAALVAVANSADSYAWSVGEGAALHAAGASNLHILLLASTSGSPAVAKLAKLLGSHAQISDLDPVGANEPAVLVTARVPGGSRELLVANVRLRFKDAIVRDA